MVETGAGRGVAGGAVRTLALIDTVGAPFPLSTLLGTGGAKVTRVALTLTTLTVTEGEERLLLPLPLLPLPLLLPSSLLAGSCPLHYK